jgi:hypothetical protein
MRGGWLRGPLRAVGLEVRRLHRSPAADPPRLFDDPLEALHYARAGVRVAFRCPLALARDTAGFSFAGDGWHPWVAELRDQGRRGDASYTGSLLERYYDRFQPRTALEALAGFDAEDHCGLADLPRHLFWSTPWSAQDVAELEHSVRDWVGRGARAHGLAGYDLAVDGTPYHGPVSARLGEVEVQRLHGVARALQRDGYDRRHGDSLFYLVRRGREFRAVKFGGGYHRTAAMSALGREHVPAQFRPPHAVDVDDVKDWPQVRSGMWSRRAALRYVDHLFDFDPVGWARDRGLE